MKTKRNESADTAKRQWTRLNPSDVPSLKCVTINQGAEAQIINISQGGTLIETDVRLQPKMKIMLKVVATKGIFKIMGTVLRSSIKSLKGAPIYQSAISFENPLTMLEDLEAKPAEEQLPDQRLFPIPEMFESRDESRSAQALPENGTDVDPAVFMVIAPDGLGISFDESFRLNDW
jgi:hypothetical protein